ncbi:hypothetical protein [Tunturibacter empetritectus]|uniref:Uncharacterized protein n=1 Tax=Tunturiibacter lichenicola TaxID=2051959 RepID=A0A7W8J7M0_9BACT|nr:hypothetical protein [Edaphobacter lichenicola]MBB5342809.1 hypothetical protein [Edaphobacter lichenicola]
MLSFCVAAMEIYCKVADVRANGFFHGGRAALAAAMAGLFGGGIVAVLVAGVSSAMGEWPRTTGVGAVKGCGLGALR